MRVTNGMMLTNMMRNLNRNMIRMDQKQMQVATGKRIHKPSDDPVGISRSLKIRADIRELDQYKRNVDDTVSWLETTELAVQNVGLAVERLRELTVQASNGVLGEDDTKKILEEVREIKNQIISLGNTTYAGKYIFSGKKTNEKLFDENGAYNDALGSLLNVKDPNKVDDKMRFQVGVGETIEINVLGFELFGGGVDLGDKIGLGEDEMGKPAGIIEMIEEIERKLAVGDTAGLTEDLAKIDAYHDQYLTVRSEIGAKVNRMQLVQNRIEDDRINFMDLQSKLEDADMGEVIMQLMNEENVYRASLSVGARVVQPSLLDFLR